MPPTTPPPRSREARAGPARAPGARPHAARSTGRATQRWIPRPAPGSATTFADLPAREIVEALRAELAAVDPGRPCCRVAERAGLGAAATGRAPSAVVARLAVRLERIPDGGARAFSLDGAPDHCRLGSG